MVDEKEKIGFRAHFCMTEPTKSKLSRMLNKVEEYTKEKIKGIDEEVTEQKTPATAVQQSTINIFRDDLESVQLFKDALVEIEVCKPWEPFRYIK